MLARSEISAVSRSRSFLIYFLYVILLATFFAQVEIQIEGDAGWAASLPTWKVEKNWFIDVVWGGRPLTGYHVWVFSFMFLVFHFPHAVIGKWKLNNELRILGGLALFWIIEDFLWFVFHPTYSPSMIWEGKVWWHHRLFLGLPTDYWTFGILGTALIVASYRRNR